MTSSPSSVDTVELLDDDLREAYEDACAFPALSGDRLRRLVRTAARQRAELRALQSQLEAAQRALLWSLREGVDENFRDGGCGCCSGIVEPPVDIRAAIDAARAGEGL